MLTEAHHQISALLRDLPTAAAPQLVRLGLFGALQQAVSDEFGDAFDEVTWDVAPEAERRAQVIAPLTAEVLFYAAREAIRNAAKHARRPEAGPQLCLHIGAEGQPGLKIVIEDNGRGWEAGLGAGEEGEARGGSGQGLALHSTLLAVVGGTLAVESVSGAYTRIVLTLPPAG